MAKHHPSNDFLMEHAAGSLPVAQAACVAAHLSYCERCRRTHDQLQTVGGAMLERLEPVAVPEALLDTVLARLDDPAPLTYSGQTEASELPGLLQRLINKDFGQLVWKRVTRALSVSYLSTGDTSYEFALLSLVTDVRASEEDEDVGLDMSEHNEQGYSL